MSYSQFFEPNINRKLSIEFPFELVIQRRGYYMMPEDSFHQWSHSPNFNARFQKQLLVAKPVKVVSLSYNKSHTWIRISYIK